MCIRAAAHGPWGEVQMNQLFLAPSRLGYHRHVQDWRISVFKGLGIVTTISRSDLLLSYLETVSAVSWKSHLSAPAATASARESQENRHLQPRSF